MVLLGGGRFLMSEVPLYFDAWRPSRRFEEPLYKGSSLTSKHPPLGPFRGPMPGALWWFWGGGVLLVSEVLLYKIAWRSQECKLGLHGDQAQTKCDSDQNELGLRPKRSLTQTQTKCDSEPNGV